METETLLAQYQHFMQDAALVRLDEIAKFTKNTITSVSVDAEGNLTPVKKG